MKKNILEGFKLYRKNPLQEVGFFVALKRSAT